MAEFATIFKRLRTDRGLTQQELADKLGITKGAVSMYERGERRPNFEIAEAITDYFGVDLTYLIGTTDKITKLSGDDTDSNSGTFVEVELSELGLLKAYRHAGAETQAAIRAILHIGE